MKLGFGRSASRAAESPFLRLVLVVGCAIALAGCTHDGRPSVAAMQPRGATVAFESIDGLPPGQFRTLVQNLNDEAQSRRLAVISREDTSSAYRVRGYLAANVVKGRTTISWVWDVFDRDQRRALRIDGEETAKATAKGPHRDGWSVADDAMLRRIARTSMDQLAVFLTSPEVAPNTAASPIETAYAGLGDSSPEAAGIFRIFRAKADPMPTETAEAPAALGAGSGPVPLPPHRPAAGIAVSPQERTTDMVTLAVSRL